MKASISAALVGLLAATGMTAEPPGAATYNQHCAACHGANGDGNGPASVWLYPKPRNFNLGLFKVQSTPSGSLPTDDDLFQTITRGMPGSSMPSFTYLSEMERRDAVQYVKHLTAVVEGGQRVNKFEAAAKSGQLAKAVEVPPEPADNVESLVLGKEVFVRAGCVTCHGESGAGDGPAAATLKDALGIPSKPRDFNTGAFRGGHTGRDLYLRIHNGMAGTPMPAAGDAAMKPGERWALVHYIQSLRRRDVDVNDILTPADGSIRVPKVAKLPAEPTDDIWESFDPVRVPLNPLWPEPKPIPAVAVTALHDGQRLAVLCTWRDGSFDGSAVRMEDFQDGVALQFSMNGSTPFLGMGDAKNPVNLWFWRAGWQSEVAGNRPDMRDIHPSMHVDFYPEKSALYTTAIAAGNVISVAHVSPVEDANARGFGTLQSQPVAQQNVQGKGVWRNGFWSVLITRDLESPDADDVKLAVGKPVPVAFAVWNGEQRDRNGRKVISNWFRLDLQN
jgi:DMSO reductase family type II enzyme heme b subunit